CQPVRYSSATWRAQDTATIQSVHSLVVLREGATRSPGLLLSPDSDPAANLRVVAPVLIAEFSRQVALLTADHRDVHHQHENGRQQQRPDEAEPERNAGVEQQHAE